MEVIWCFKRVQTVLKLIEVASKSEKDLEVHHALRKLERNGRWIRVVDPDDNHDGRVLGRAYLVRGHACAATHQHFTFNRAWHGSGITDE